MLSAEHFALEHAAVQQLLGIREREVTHMTDRFNALGTQASLLAGFIVTTLTAVSVAEAKALEGIRQCFWASSALALACAMHCVICSTFAAVWGPGLALRGPQGSVSKAYWGMTRERNHIMISYVGALFFFVMQSIFAFYVIDEQTGLTVSSSVATCVLGFGTIVSAATLWRMNRRFFFLDTDTLVLSGNGNNFEEGNFRSYDAVTAAGGGGGGGGEGKAGDEAMLAALGVGGNGGIGGIDGLGVAPGGSIQGVGSGGSAASSSSSSSSSSGGGSFFSRKKKQPATGEGANLQEPLLSGDGKGGGGRGGGGAGGAGGAAGGGGGAGNSNLRHVVVGAGGVLRVQRGQSMFHQQGYLMKQGKMSGKLNLRGQWKRRYCVLHGSTLWTFATEEEYREKGLSSSSGAGNGGGGTGDAKAIRLRGYEVLVHTDGKDQHRFALSPLPGFGSGRERGFKCESKEELTAWLRALVAACVVAQ